jgi:hypothetical protein
MNQTNAPLHQDSQPLPSTTAKSRRAGASAAEGLAVGLTIRAVTLCVSLVGGLVFLYERHDRKLA